MCLLINERYKTYQTGFSFRRLRHAPGVGLRGTVGGWGSKKYFFPNSTRFGVCVTYMNGTCNGTIFLFPTSWGLGEGPKGQISLNLNYNVNFKDFYTKLRCLLTNERYKTYQTGFSFGHLGHVCPRVWDLGCAGGQKFNFLNMVISN